MEFNIVTNYDRLEFDERGEFDMAEPQGKDIRNIVELLDNFAQSGEGRMKLRMAENMEDEATKKEYHHGRCDVGSPWACNHSLDALDKEY